MNLFSLKYQTPETRRARSISHHLYLSTAVLLAAIGGGLAPDAEAATLYVDATAGGAINNFSSSPILFNSILWNNQAAASTTTPGASVANANASTTTYSHCLVANSGGSGNWNGILGTDLGSNIDTNPLFLQEVDPASAPVAGGNLRLTVGSPAIDAGLNAANTSATDLAGNPRIYNLIIDLGAYESAFGFADLWDTDFDNDGNPFGVEHALGTDPGVADLGHAANLSGPAFNGGGEPSFAFRRNPAANADTIWILSRSADLTPGSFIEIYRFHGPTATHTLYGTTSILGATSITVTDNNPLPDHAYYRFEAAFVPSDP